MVGTGRAINGQVKLMEEVWHVRLRPSRGLREGTSRGNIGVYK